MKRLFKRKCHHHWEVTERSNVLQQDGMGYPLRLVIVKCTKCGVSEHQWHDVPVSMLKQLDTGEAVLLKWSKA